MLGIVLLTYAGPTSPERLDYAVRTLRAALKYVETDDPIHLHIADDGSADHEGHVNTLTRVAWAYLESNEPGHRITWHNSEHRGYGASYNLATQFVHDDCEHVIYLEDDWELQRPLQVDPLRAVLGKSGPYGTIGMVRLGYLGFWEPLRGTVDHIERQTVLALDPQSLSADVFAGHPRIVHREWERIVGPWPEGLAAGQTEVSVAARPAARTGVVWPMDVVAPRGDLFSHIGTVSVNNERPES